MKYEELEARIQGFCQHWNSQLQNVASTNELKLVEEETMNDLECIRGQLIKMQYRNKARQNILQRDAALNGRKVGKFIFGNIKKNLRPSIGNFEQENNVAEQRSLQQQYEDLERLEKILDQQNVQILQLIGQHFKSSLIL